MSDIDYWGGCPEPGCGRHNGNRNVGRHHWFACDEHKTKWSAGENLFSHWREEPRELHERNAALLDTYREVEPVNPTAEEVNTPDWKPPEWTHACTQGRP